MSDAGSDVEMLDDGPAAYQNGGGSGLDKGKGREVEDDAPPKVIAENALHGHELDNLPWSVCEQISLPLSKEADLRSTMWHCGTALRINRVEKYRPATLDDVVSHADITTTSASWPGIWGERLC
jgi:hypothetical protein